MARARTGYPEQYASPGAIRYVRTTGDDNEDGTTWATAKATVVSAVAALPTDGTSHHGTIRIGPGTHTTAGNLELNWGIEYRGSGTDDVGGGTLLQLANGANAWMFTPTSGWLGDGTSSNYSHHARLRDMRLDGNESQQTNPTTVSGVNLTFANAPPTITRASGDWTADGYVAGDYVEVRGDTNGNDGMYEVKSIDSATVLRLWDTTASGKRAHEFAFVGGPISGITVIGVRYGILRWFNGGFNTFCDNVFFKNSRLGVLQIKSALNMNFWRCTAATLTCRWLFFRSYGDVQVSIIDSQVDHSGAISIEIHRNHTGGGHLWNIIGGKWETSDAALHRHIVLARPMENGTGSAWTINLDGIKIVNSASVGADDYAFYESRTATGFRPNWRMIGVIGGSYTGLFKSLGSGRVIGTVSANQVDSGLTIVEGTQQRGNTIVVDEIVSTPATLISGNNTFNMTTSDSTVVRMTGNAAGSNLIGISGGREGRILKIIHLDGLVTVVNESGSATAANRILCGSNFTPTADDITELMYDATTQRWRVIDKQVI